MERNAFLAGTPLFSGVASQEVGAMLDCLDAHERRYAQGERIHHMGDSVSTAGIVLTGRVRIEHVDPWGNVSVVGMRGPGAMFGEAYATAGEPLLVDVVADQDCTVLFLNLAKVVGPCSCRCDHHALVARNMIAAIARQSLALSRRIFHVAPKSIRGKVLAYLSNEAERTGTREFDIPFNRPQARPGQDRGNAGPRHRRALLLHGAVRGGVRQREVVAAASDEPRLLHAGQLRR